MLDLSFLRDNARWLAAGALLAFLSSFGQTFFIAIFSGEIRESFDLSHTTWGAMYTIGTTVSAICVVWAGGLADHYRSRALGSIVLCCLAASCLFMAINPVAALIPVSIFLLRFFGQGMMTHISKVSMSRWLVASRGKALAFAGLGFAVAEGGMPFVFTTLLEYWDWRWLWVLAAVIALCGLPVLRHLLKSERTPQSIAKDNDAPGLFARHWTRRGCLNHWLFWAMVPVLLGPSAFQTAFFFQQVHYAETKGWAHIDLVALFPIFSICLVTMMLGSGWLLDRFGTARVIIWYQLPFAAGFFLFATADTLLLAAVGVAMTGLSSGMNATLPNAFWAEFYGTRHIGAIKSMAHAVMVFGSAIGPGITGYLIDQGVSIETQYVWVMGYFLLTTVLMLFAISRAARLRHLPAANADV